MKKVLFSSTIFLLLFFGCYLPQTTDPCDCGDRPWYMCCPPVAKDMYYGTGNKAVASESLGRTGAIQDATFQVALSVFQDIKGALKNFEQCSGVDDCVDFISKVQKTIVDTELSGVVVKQTHPLKENPKSPIITWYALVQYPKVNTLPDIVPAIDNNKGYLPKEETLWNEFKASQAFEDLENDLQKK